MAAFTSGSGLEIDSRKPEADPRNDVNRNMEIKQAQEHIDLPSTEEQSALIRQEVATPNIPQYQRLMGLISSNIVPAEKKLGEGSFGEVAVGKMDFAIKKPRSGENLKHEYEVLSSLSHRNILIYVAYDPGPPERLIIEKMQGSLRQYVKFKEKNLGIETILAVASDVAHGLEYLHGEGYLHDDLKAPNILISLGPDIAKIGDFGLAKKISPHNPNMRYCLHYDGQRFKVVTGFPETFKIDVWSYGCVLVEMALGDPPNLSKLAHLVQRTYKKFPDLKNLIIGCTQILFADRFNISEVVKIVDSFFQMSGIEEEI